MEKKLKKLKKVASMLLMAGIIFATNASEIKALDTGYDELIPALAEFKESMYPDTVGDEETVDAVGADTISQNQLSIKSIEDTYLEEEVANRLSVDAFALTTTKKGAHGWWGENCQHAFFNAYMTYDNLFSGEPYTYEGETYYFSNCVSGAISGLNASGITVSVQFLVPYDSNHPEMIEPAAREGGHFYYAPNASDPAMAKRYRAYFEYLGEKYSNAECHIDNWILGNEVNMPQQWNWFGSLDVNTCVSSYATTYLAMYNGVKKWTNSSRVSICVDHSWQHNDMGRGIAAKDFINTFHNVVNARQGDIDWCIATHLYPAILYETDIWAGPCHLTGQDLNPKSDSAWFVDGNNLSVMTNYIKNTFGAKHRIMLTEQGISDHFGVPIQAACLAYTYYAAAYDDMVDCIMIFNANAGDKLNFTLTGPALDVFNKMNSTPADQQWVADYCLPIIGVSSWSDIVPNFGKEPLKPIDKEKVNAFVTRLYKKCLGRNPDPAGLNDWTGSICSRKITGAEAAMGFFFSDEYLNKNVSSDQFIEDLYYVMIDRGSDPAGKADWKFRLENGVERIGILNGFIGSQEYTNICNSYGITRGNLDLKGRNRNPGLTLFVARLYTKALGRNFEAEGLNNWCDLICDRKWTIDDVATTGFFNSDEFLNKNTSNGEYVKILYATFLNRKPDPEGYKCWVDNLENGEKRENILKGFSQSVEFAELKAGYGL